MKNQKSDISSQLRIPTGMKVTLSLLSEPEANQIKVVTTLKRYYDRIDLRCENVCRLSSIYLKGNKSFKSVTRCLETVKSKFMDY
jgi:hypothetical protein